MSGEELPEGWAETTLGAVTLEKVPQSTPSSAFTYVDISSVDNDSKAIVDPKSLGVDEAPSRARQPLRASDVIVSLTRPNLNAVALVPDALDGSVGSTGFHVLRTSVCEPRFLFALVKGGRFVQEMTDVVKGALYPAINAEHVRVFGFGMPPLAEQKRIVARLDSLQARSRAAREALAEVPALLDTFRQSVLAAAFRGDLTAEWRAKNPDVEPASKLLERVRKAHGEWWASTGRKKKWEPAKALYAGDESLPELPPGWAWASSAEIVRPGTIITYGIVLPGAHVPGGVPYVRGGDIENGQILVDQLLCTAPEIAATKPDSELEPDDVLLCIIRHLKVAVVPPALHGANLTQGTVRLRCSEAASSGYLANYLASPFAQEWMKAKHFGLAMPRINVEDAREVPVPIPPKAEQVAIAEVLATAMEKLRGLENAALQHAAELDTLDQSILARAFRGELVDQDPNDEPAEALLARIKGEPGTPGIASKGWPRRSVGADR